MAELFAKDTGTCRGTGGSMHIYDKETNFQGGWGELARPDERRFLQLRAALGFADSNADLGSESDEENGTGRTETVAHKKALVKIAWADIGRFTPSKQRKAPQNPAQSYASVASLAHTPCNNLPFPENTCLTVQQQAANNQFRLQQQKAELAAVEKAAKR